MGRWIGTVLALGLLAGIAEADVVMEGQATSGHEAITVSSAAKGVTANLCGSGNTGKALFQVKSNDIYVSFYSTSATPANTDFLVTAGSFFSAEPAAKVRMIRVTNDATVIVQCFQ